VAELTDRNIMTMRRSHKWFVIRTECDNASALRERPEFDGILSHRKVSERYKVMILSHQTDRLDRDHKVLIFHCIK
jgi:hypothetical protein